MTHELPGHTAPAVGFEVPLEMLSACHGRVQHQCATLLRLLKHLPTHGADPPAQQAAQAVMRYFDSAARHHHEDEELDLFPALHGRAASDESAWVEALTLGLCRDHRDLEQRWAAVRRWLQQVASGDSSHDAQADAKGFVQAYERHIALEEAELLPLAARLLDAARLDRIGRTMRARRGLADDQL